MRYSAVEPSDILLKNVPILPFLLGFQKCKLLKMCAQKIHQNWKKCYVHRNIIENPTILSNLQDKQY